MGYYPSYASATQALAANQSLPDTFYYTVSDSHGATATGTVNVTVNGQNDPPLAAMIPDVAHGAGDGSTVIDLDQYFNDTVCSTSRAHLPGDRRHLSLAV